MAERKTPFPDVTPVRRRIMSAIRSKNTRPEKLVRSALHSVGYRFRIHANDLPGRPDIVFRSRKIAIFVHGCFWHAHEGCVGFRIPRTRTEFWTQKLSNNSLRDAQSAAQLREQGWSVIVVWECDIRANRLARFFTELSRVYHNTKCPVVSLHP